MALKEIFLIIWLIYFVQYVYCNAGAIFGKKYLEASEWTPTIESHIRTKVECAAHCKATTSCSAFSYNGSCGVGSLACKTVLDAPTATSTTIYMDADSGPPPATNILIVANTNNDGFRNALLTVDPASPGSSVCVQSWYFSFAADDWVDAYDATNPAMGFMAGNAYMCPFYIYHTPASRRSEFNRKCYTNLTPGSTVIGKSLTGSLDGDVNKRFTFVEIPGNRLWAMGHHRTSITSTYIIHADGTMDNLGPQFPSPFSAPFLVDMCLVPVGSRTLILQYDRIAFYNWDTLSFENVGHHNFGDMGQQNSRCAKVMWNDGQERVVFLMGDVAANSRRGMKVQLMDTNNLQWTEYEFPKPLETGVTFDGNGRRVAFGSDGSRLYYYAAPDMIADLDQMRLYIHNPTIDNDGTWHIHPFTEFPQFLFSYSNYEFHFI